MSQDEVILTFPVGLAGFPKLTKFRLFEPPKGYPLKFLQSTEDPQIAFLCIEVATIKLDYEVPLSDEQAAMLALEKAEDALVLATVVVPENPRDMTANLAGPLVINMSSGIGRQIELPTDKFPIKFPVFEHKEEEIVSFPRGLVGIPELKSFRLFEPQESYPLKFLQAVDKPEVSFVCVDVAAIKPDYSVPLNQEDADFLALEKPNDALVLALVVIPEDPKQMTANLAGPLVLNIRTHQGRQVVLSIDKYPLRYPLSPDPH